MSLTLPVPHLWNRFRLWGSALALIALGFASSGCSGGASGPNGTLSSLKVGTQTQGSTSKETPRSAAKGVAKAVSKTQGQSYSFRATVSNVRGAVIPASLRFSEGVGGISLQQGYNDFTVTFSQDTALSSASNLTAEVSLVLNVPGNLTTIRSGQKYALSSPSSATIQRPGDKSLRITVGGKSYTSRSGTLRVTQRIEKPNQGNPAPLTSLKFILDNVKLGADTINANSDDGTNGNNAASNPEFTLTGSGECTVVNHGELILPTLSGTRAALLRIPSNSPAPWGKNS